MRFYKETLPDVDDIVMCRVKKIESDSIYVTLLEYDSIEGMVQLANASTRRKKRSICLLKEGKQYPLLVIAVDEDKGYLDLSNKYLAEEDKEEATNKYYLYQKVIKMYSNFLIKKVGKDYTDEQYEEYANKTIWKIKNSKCYDYLIEKYFANQSLEFDLDDEEMTLFLENLKDFCGEFQILSKLVFMLRNPNYRGVETIKSLFDIVKNDYGLAVVIDDVPTYHIELMSNSKVNNEEQLDIISSLLQTKSNELKMFYTKSEISSSIKKV